MTLRILVLIIGLSLLSCNSANSKNEINFQKAEPNYNIAVNFINDYIDYRNNLTSEVRIIEWVNSRQDVTNDFKAELKRILSEAEKKDPELGLGFDPIFDAQDNPNEFEIESKNSEYLVVKSVEWSDFLLTLKLKFEDNKWLVDGSGVINVPRNKRIER